MQLHPIPTPRSCTVRSLPTSSLYLSNCRRSRTIIQCCSYTHSLHCNDTTQSIRPVDCVRRRILGYNSTLSSSLSHTVRFESDREIECSDSTIDATQSGNVRVRINWGRRREGLGGPSISPALRTDKQWRALPLRKDSRSRSSASQCSAVCSHRPRASTSNWSATIIML